MMSGLDISNLFNILQTFCYVIIYLQFFGFFSIDSRVRTEDSTETDDHIMLDVVSSFN